MAGILGLSNLIPTLGSPHGSGNLQNRVTAAEPDQDYIKFNKEHQAKHPKVHKIRQFWRGIAQDSNTKSLRVEKEAYDQSERDYKISKN